MTRSYTVLTPAKKTLPASAPIIVALSGLNSTQDQEIGRDGLTPYVIAGDAEVVYPLAYRESWNAIGCCSWAAQADVNDVGFIQALVKQIDPGHERPDLPHGLQQRRPPRLHARLPGPAAVRRHRGREGGPDAVVRHRRPAEDPPGRVDRRHRRALVHRGEGQLPGDRRPRWSRTPTCATPTSARPQSVSSHQGNMTLTTWADCLDGVERQLRGLHRRGAQLPAAAGQLPGRVAGDLGLDQRHHHGQAGAEVVAAPCHQRVNRLPGATSSALGWSPCR